jgi:hypothetical protein
VRSGRGLAVLKSAGLRADALSAAGPAEGSRPVEVSGFTHGATQVPKPLDVPPAWPQPHPLLADHRPAHPAHGLGAIGGSVHPVTRATAHHRPADPGSARTALA